MLVGGMIGHIVQNDLEIALVRLIKQYIEVVKGSEKWIDIGIITDIIAKIRHGRRIHRRKPHSINPKPLQVIELAGDTWQITYPVTIAIKKTAWINLINNARLPPGVRMCHLID